MQTVHEALIGQRVAMMTSYVMNHTSVDGYLLAEDDGFRALMTKGLENNTPLSEIVISLIEYVNNNY